MSEQVYYNDGSKPDEDHPRAGWYCIVDDQGDERIFGPFVSQQHAAEFKEHTETTEEVPPH